MSEAEKIITQTLREAHVNAGAADIATDVVIALYRAGYQITPQAGEAEPAYYAVVDEEGDVIELTKDKQYAHDFINDAIASAMEQDITLANRWVVRPLYHTAPPRPVAPVCQNCRGYGATSIDAELCKVCGGTGRSPPPQGGPGWQPISTAPRDTPVLVGRWGRDEWLFCKSILFFEPAGYEGDGANGWLWAIDDDPHGICEDEGPSHWLALDALPLPPTPPDSPGAPDEVEDAGAEVDRQSMEYAAGGLKPWRRGET